MADFRNFLQNNSNTLLQTGIGLIGGQNAQQQATMGLQGFAQGRQANKTLEFLRQANPDLAQGVETGAISPGDAYKLYYQQKIEAQKPKNNYISAGKALYNVETGQWVTPPAGASAADEEWGLNPVWGKDSSGKTVLGQVSKNGKFKPLETGDFQPTPTIQNLDVGSGIISINSKSGETVRETHKDLAGAEAAKATGKAQGEAQAAIPATRGMASLIDSQVQALKSDPYLPEMLGPINSRKPNLTADAARVQGKIDQLKGGAFLQARQMLKGGGAITDYEGQKAEAAFARMITAQSVEDFNAALDEFNAAVQQGLAKIEAQAGGGAVAPAQASPRKTSTGVQWSVE